MRRIVELGGYVAAVVLVAFGVSALVIGLNGRGEVRDNLTQEKIFGGSENNIDPGFTNIARLKPFAAIQGSQDQLYGMFDSGVGAASVEFGSFTRMYAESRNPNIVIADPTEGQVVAMNVACITTGTRRVERSSRR